MVPSSCHTIEELRVLDPWYGNDFSGHEYTWDTRSDSIWDHAAIDTTIQGRASAEAFEPALQLDEEVCFGLIPDIQVRLEKDFDSNSDLYLGALSPQDPL
ncbi:hypothetical protein G6514_002750, partial [Epicoccum nigrum]